MTTTLPRPNRPGTTTLLKRAMKLHGGTIDDFAKQVLGRSRVSIWRWLRNAHPIPLAVRERLRTYCREIEPDPQPARFTDAD